VIYDAVNYERRAPPRRQGRLTLASPALSALIATMISPPRSTATDIASPMALHVVVAPVATVSAMTKIKMAKLKKAKLDLSKLNLAQLKPSTLK
jgi:hypothetical protein